MKEQVQALYELGLEKFAGDAEQAGSFVEGFLKEASGGFLTNPEFIKGLQSTAGKGVMALGLGLGIHGIATMMASANTSALKSKFEQALQQVVRTNPIVADYDQGKVRSFAETIFKFAPNVAADPNLLAHVLSNACHGESLDTTTIRALADLDSRVVESRKALNFSPKVYT